MHGRLDFDDTGVNARLCRTDDRDGISLERYAAVSNAVAASGNAPNVRLTLQTVASIGFGPHPDWVSYLVKNANGKWVHSTNLVVPANS